MAEVIKRIAPDGDYPSLSAFMAGEARELQNGEFAVAEVDSSAFPGGVLYDSVSITGFTNCGPKNHVVVRSVPGKTARIWGTGAATPILNSLPYTQIIGLEVSVFVGFDGVYTSISTSGSHSVISRCIAYSDITLNGYGSKVLASGARRIKVNANSCAAIQCTVMNEIVVQAGAENFEGTNNLELKGGIEKIALDVVNFAKGDYRPIQGSAIEKSGCFRAVEHRRINPEPNYSQVDLPEANIRKKVTLRVEDNIVFQRSPAARVFDPVEVEIAKATNRSGYSA